MFNSKIQTLRILALSGVALAAFAATPALAADTAELEVGADVVEVCNVTTTAIDFGDVDVTAAANKDATGGFSVICTSGASWTVAANEGNGTSATPTNRKMMSSTNVLNYALYNEVGRTTNFTGATGEGTGAAQASTIYGRVPGSQNSLPAGAYADSVTITVTVS